MASYNCQASWFDCSASAPGACGTCRSGNLQAAMQNLRGHTPPCYCGCHTAAVSCGTRVAVHNPCNGKSVTVSIADHGPGACGGSPAGCRGYRPRYIDLTRAAFSAIAPLSEGLASVTISY